MTTSHTIATPPESDRAPTGTSRDPWDGLTADDATRITAALAATHAENTRKVYAFAWRRWVRWCAGRGIVAFPAQPAAICAYLTECAEHGLSLATIDLACSAIGHQDRRHGVPDPVDHEAVCQVRRGLRRIIGRAPRRPTRPLSVEEVRQIVTAIDRSTVRGARDTAIMLLGFAGALRRSELAALTLADLEPKPVGLLLHRPRPGLHQPARPTTLPGADPGNAVSNLVKERALSAGLSGGRISGHSLRAGHATSAALAGIGIDRIAAQTRHRRIDILIERYIRPVQALQTTSSRDLGL